jgi:cytochrome c
VHKIGTAGGQRNKRFVKQMMKLKLAVVVWALAFFVPNNENTPPVVKILAPKNGSSVDPNSQVRYSISVSDKEDGDSKYQEINPLEVLLQVRYVPDASPAEKQPATTGQNSGSGTVVVQAGLQSMLQSNCLNCHAFNAPLLGPSFFDINGKYGTNTASKNTLVRHVLEGSTGIWGKGVMPSHPELTKEIAAAMVQWILEKAGDKNVSYYSGTEGAIRLTAPSANSKGAFILTASYKDHNTAEDPKNGLTGSETIMIHVK